MRHIRSILALAVALPLLAITAHAADKPANLEPLPDVPPPPPGVDPDTEPQITITKKGTDTIEEYRVNGELYEMKVTPANGKPYYLLKADQNGGWTRSDGPGESISIPKWVLFRF